jgi:hypothetical protein
VNGPALIIMVSADALGVTDIFRSNRIRIRVNGATKKGVECCMAKEQEAVDNLLDALVWMRRKSKKHEPVDALIDELVKMRRKAKTKVARKKTGKKKTRKRAKR